MDMFENDTANLSANLRDTAGLTLAQIADDSVIDDVIRLAKKRRLGDARVPMLVALYRSKDPRAKMLLLKLRDDPPPRHGIRG